MDLNRYQPEMLWFADDVFTIHHGWTLAYAARDEAPRLACTVRMHHARRPYERALADALAELGCFRVWIGSESGSQRMLDAMQRGVTVAQVREAVHLAQTHGIRPACSSCGAMRAKDSRTSRPPMST